MRGFLEWKHSLGCKYQSAEIDLADFDHFLACEKEESPILTQHQLDRYVGSCRRIKPSTLRIRLGLVRRFCLYLRRYEPASIVPHQRWARVRVPQYQPRILSPTEFRKLIVGTHVLLQGRRWSLREETFRTLLYLLYGTGLRPGEALRLTVQDVDLTADVLTIRETKFYKSRLVPMARSLSNLLSRYADRRNEVFGVREPQSAFFPSKRGTAYSIDTIEEFFRQLVSLLNLSTDGGRGPPRLHDLRHGFAVERLLQWYREGANVQSKLPLLSTYLGHADIVATRVYLTVTAGLLEEANRRFETHAGHLITL